MSHALSTTLLVVGTIGWFLLALLPALREHFGRTDIGPLRLTSEAADIRFFALSFHRYVQRQLTALRVQAAGKRTMVTTLTDGTGAWYASAGDEVVTIFTADELTVSTDTLAAVSEANIVALDDTTVARELYTSGSLEGGKRNIYRAILVGDDASLAEETTIVRWADAGGSMRVGRDSTLWGRASCWGTMSLAEGTRFQRLAAPRIEFGAPARINEPAIVAEVAVEPPSHAAVGSGRWKIDGDFTVPEGGVIESDLVLTGTLTVGRGAKLHGAVRSGAVLAADDCVFSKSIVAAERLVIGERCQITGPVVVEGEAVIGAGCRVGEPGDETTISALLVRVAPGVVLCGEVWARRQGIVATAGKGAGSESELLAATDERATSW